MRITDKNGIEVYVGVDVEVPSPTDNDQWNFDFVGVIIEIDKENGYAVVEDGDGNCWCVECERLEIQ
jgi:hypothetical protein